MNLFLHAEVNVKDASFFKTWTEEIFHRTYKSRSVHKGWLGTGWCTELEKSLEILRDEIILTDCVLDYEIKFVKKDSIYITTIGEQDIISVEGQNYVRRVHQTVQKFNQDGKLISMVGKNQRPITITYSENGTFREAHIGEYKITLIADSKKGKAARLQGPRMADFLYLISEQGLMEVRSGDTTMYKYKYGEFDNLTKITSYNKPEYLKYDQQDRITEYISADGCRNQYFYYARSSLHSQSVRQRQCQNRKPEKIIYDFFYEKNPDGGFTLLKATRRHT